MKPWVKGTNRNVVVFHCQGLTTALKDLNSWQKSNQTYWWCTECLCNANGEHWWLNVSRPLPLQLYWLKHGFLSLLSGAIPLRQRVKDRALMRQLHGHDWLECLLISCYMVELLPTLQQTLHGDMMGCWGMLLLVTVTNRTQNHSRRVIGQWTAAAPVTAEFCPRTTQQAAVAAVHSCHNRHRQTHLLASHFTLPTQL